MKLFLTVIALTICANYLLVPSLWVQFNGGTADPQGLLLIQLIVFLAAGMAMGVRTGHKANPGAFARGFRHALTATICLAAVVALTGAAYGVFNRFEWGPVAMFCIAVIGFVFVRPAAQNLALSFAAKAQSRTLTPHPVRQPRS